MNIIRLSTLIYLLTAATSILFIACSPDEDLCDLPISETTDSLSTTCLTLSNNSSKDIPDGASESSGIAVDKEGKIKSIEVNKVRIMHPYIKDVSVKLKSPCGESIVLYSSSCANANLNIGFSDDGKPYNTMYCPPIDGANYRPFDSENNQVSFDKWVGERANGNWILTVTDKDTYDTGFLHSWEITVCVEH